MAGHVQTVVDRPVAVGPAPGVWSFGMDGASRDDLYLAQGRLRTFAACILHNDPRLQGNITAFFANHFDAAVLSRDTQLPIGKWQRSAPQFADVFLMAKEPVVVGVALVAIARGGGERLRRKAGREEQGEETAED